MFSFLEDLGETVIDVGTLAALDKYGGDDKPEETKPAPTVATPAAYEKTQKPVAVNDDGAPVKTVSPQTNNTMLLLGGGAVLLLTVVLLVTRNK